MSIVVRRNVEVAGDLYGQPVGKLLIVRSVSGHRARHARVETAASPNEIRRRTKPLTAVSNRAPPASAAHPISGRPTTMPIPKPSTNVAKLAACASGAESPSRPDRHAPPPKHRARQGDPPQPGWARWAPRLADTAPTRRCIAPRRRPARVPRRRPRPARTTGRVRACRSAASAAWSRATSPAAVCRSRRPPRRVEHPRIAAARPSRSPPSTTCCGMRSARRPSGSGPPRDALSAATGWAAKAPGTTPGRPGSPILLAPLSKPPTGSTSSTSASGSTAAGNTPKNRRIGHGNGNATRGWTSTQRMSHPRATSGAVNASATSRSCPVCE